MPLTRRKNEVEEKKAVGPVPVERVLFAIGQGQRELDEDVEEGIPYPADKYTYESSDDDDLYDDRLAHALALKGEAAPADPEQMTDPGEDTRLAQMRKHRRKPIYSDARLSCPDGRTIDCMILDFSEGGAKVRFITTMQLPEKLKIVSKRPTLDTLARVAWQNGSTAGLQFLASNETHTGQLTFEF